MYIRVKKRHDNHDFQPHALAFPSILWWGKREWQSRAPYEISNPHTFFFFFRSSVPCVAYVDIILKGVKPQQILADPDNGDSMIQSRNYPQRAKKVILMRIWWFVTFHTKRWSDDLYPVPGCRGKEKREKWFTVTRNGTKTSCSRWCPLYIPYSVVWIVVDHVWKVPVDSSVGEGGEVCKTGWIHTQVGVGWRCKKSLVRLSYIRIKLALLLWLCLIDGGAVSCNEKDERLKRARWSFVK